MKKIIAVILSVSMLMGIPAFAEEELPAATTEAAAPVEKEAEPTVAPAPPPEAETTLEPEPAAASPAAAEEAEEIPEMSVLSNESYVTPPPTGIEWETNDTGYAYKAPYNEETELDFTDPEYISDEDFFGVWKNGAWTKTGYLKYEEYDGLSEVEALAKQGNYAEAKDALLTYYRAREKQYARPDVGGDTKKNILSAQLLEHNYTWNENSNANLVDIKTVDSHDYKLVEVDVTDFVKTVLDSTTTEMPFYLTARNKDGAQISILSKEYGTGKQGASISVVSNGVATDYGVKEDAMVACGYGSNAGTNYKNATELLLEESLSSVNTRTPTEEGTGRPSTFPVDENSRRVHFKFDLAGAGASSAVTSATLKFYARINDKENTVNRKDLVLFVTKNVDWNENTVTYNSTNHYIFSYEHEPSIRWHRPWLGAAGHRYTDELYRLQWLGHPVGQYKFAADNNEEYAYTALRIWAEFLKFHGGVDVCKEKHWAEGSGSEVIDSHLGVAVRSQNMPQILMQVLDSKHFSGELLTASLKYMCLEGRYAKNRKPNTNNIGAQQISGLYNLGITFQELREGESWQDKALELLPDYTKNYMMADGTIKEVALGYVNYAMGGVWAVQDYADQMNVHVEYSDEMKETLRTMAYYLMYVSGPGARELQQGDGYAYSSTAAKSVIKEIADLTGDVYLEYIATDGARGKMPPDTSKMFDKGKKYAMRSNWTKSAVFLQTNADNAYESHGHKDDLSIIMYAYDQYLLADPMYSSYQGGAASTWLTGTTGHNTVVVNNTSQTSSSNTANQGITNRWEANGVYDFADVSTKNYANQNVSHTRKILFIRPGYFLVSDYLLPTDDASKNYKQYWHFQPDANVTINDKTSVVKTNTSGANVQVATAVDDSTKGVLKNDGYYGLGHSGIINNVKYAYYEQSKKGAATFDTLLYPEEVGKSGLVETKAESLPLSSVTNNGASAMEITIHDKKDGTTTTGDYYIVHDKAQKQQRAFGDFVTDGELAYLEKQDNGFSTAILQEGTSLSASNGGYYIYTTGSVHDFGVSRSENTLSLSSSKDADLSQITVYAPETVNTVKWNGANVSFKRSGAYLYFGDAPLLAENTVAPEDSSSNEPSPLPTPSVPDHSGGSGGNGGGGGTSNPGVIPGNPGTVNPDPSVDPVEQELSGHWAEQEIRSMMDRGVIKGDDSGSLSLGRTTTRAEFAAMLVRSLGLDTVSYSGEFNDVAADSWYADVMATAKANGIMEGSDGNADPDRPVTREEMAKMLVAVCSMNGIQAEATQELAFPDADSVSGWAEESVKEAVALGLMNGMDTGELAPKDNALREQVVVVLYRMMEQIEKQE